MRVRAENEEDHEEVRKLNESAFGTSTEADLIAKLREDARPFISLVADKGGSIIGHVMFSPATLGGHPELNLMALAPMAVAPKEQGQGVGSALVRAGLAECRKRGIGAVALIGHPEYYPRFGFLPGAQYGIASEFDAPPEAFMVIELQPNYLRNASGTLRFHDAFNDV